MRSPAATTGTDEHPSLTGLRFTPEDLNQSLPERFEQVVSQFPDRTALIGSGRCWTYSELNKLVNRIAHAIRSRTAPGVDCVAYLAHQSPEMVVCTLAILKAGKAYLAIHPEIPTAAQRAILEDARPELLLAVPGLAAQASEIAAGACEVFILHDVDDRYPDENPTHVTGPQDPSTIFSTSGTTGQPKLVVKTHRAVLHRVLLSTDDGIGPDDRQSLLTHTSFSASESDMFGALLQGARVCVFDVGRHGIPALRSWIDEEQITLLHPPVLLFRRFLSTLEGQNLFPSVRLVALAGDAVLPADVIKWRQHFTRGCQLVHRFSTTESAVLSVARFDCDSTNRPQSVDTGHPVAGKDVTLVDEKGLVVADGEIGEIVVRSRYIAEGYWRRPEETAAAFRRDPDDPEQRTYHTGDRGRFLPDGSLLFAGRRHHLAKIRGYRVDAREVDSVLLELGDVVESATIVEKADDDDQLTSFVVMKPGHRFDSRSLRERLRPFLPEWKIPARLEAIPALPTTLNDKVDRRLLESLIKPAGPIASGVLATPEIDQAISIEDELADIWRVVLGLEVVGYDDNFIDLGGHSISAMMALNWIDRQYRVRIPPADLFRHATIRQFAAFLRSQVAAAVPVPAVAAPASVAESVSDAFVELLNAHAVDYVYVNPGTDTAPILESIAKFQAEGRRAPQLILCLHESVAMAAAHGYYMVTGRPQVVLVHVDVGTQNLGANLHNAQRGRAGVVVCAGRAPYTVDGSLPGGRNRYTHWLQEQPNQASTVQGYVKWHYELTSRENLSLAVHRAFQMAASEPAGPVYLTLPREVLMQKIEGPIAEAKGHALATAAADPVALAQAARWLIDAGNPLILVAYAGRNPQAVASLVRLADTLAIPVVESRHRLNFPSTHPMHLGFAPARYLHEADCVLVVDHDVPWVPTQSRPAAGARIIQVDIDPLKRDIPIWGFPVDLAIHADSSIACAALTDEIERQLTPQDRMRIEARRSTVTAEHTARATRLQQRTAELAARKPIAAEWAAHCLNDIVDVDTLIIGEVVSNSQTLWSHLQLDRPATYYQSLGNGLGWGLGAALGAKMAAPSKTVICAVGDGSWLFGSPIAVYWAAEQHHCPFLTVIFGNREYAATVEAIQTTAPEGYAMKLDGYPACDLPQPPMYARLAEAMGVWARTVEDPAALPSVLREALARVRSGRSALVDISIASSRSAGRPTEG